MSEYVASELDLDRSKQLTRLASALPLAFIAVVYNSILGLGTASSTLNISCPTGYCTFDRSHTLGFCSICNDVTAEVTQTCEFIPRSDTTNETICTYSLSSGVDIEARDIEVLDAEEPSLVWKRTTNMSVVALHRYGTLYGNDPNAIGSVGGLDFETPAPGKTVLQGAADPILAFGRIMFNGSDDPLSGIGGSVMPTSTECVLYWCAQTLDTSIQNGVLKQAVVGNWSDGSALDTSDIYLQPNFTSDVGGKGDSVSYYVSPMINLPLLGFLQDTFTATVNCINLLSEDLTGQEPLQLTTYSSSVAQALWLTDDLDSLMSNLADRMTDVLRNLYSDPASDASNFGKVYTTQTYVVVSWPWLILPIGLVLASCMVLFAAIISSCCHQTTVWKSSSLVVLFHGLAGSGERTGSSVEDGWKRPRKG